jgi:hypothetical protein
MSDANDLKERSPLQIRHYQPWHFVLTWRWFVVYEKLTVGNVIVTQ